MVNVAMIREVRHRASLFVSTDAIRKQRPQKQRAPRVAAGALVLVTLSGGITSWTL